MIPCLSDAEPGCEAEIKIADLGCEAEIKIADLAGFDKVVHDLLS